MGKRIITCERCGETYTEGARHKCTWRSRLRRRPRRSAPESEDELGPLLGGIVLVWTVVEWLAIIALVGFLIWLLLLR